MIEIITGKRKRRESLVFSGLTIVLYVTIMPPGDRGFAQQRSPEPMAGSGQQWEVDQLRVLVSMSRGGGASLSPLAIPMVTSLSRKCP